jgi:hypothetical protein
VAILIEILGRGAPVVVVVAAGAALAEVAAPPAVVAVAARAVVGALDPELSEPQAAKTMAEAAPSATSSRGYDVRFIRVGSPLIDRYPPGGQVATPP